MVEQWSPKPPMNVRFVPAPPVPCRLMVGQMVLDHSIEVRALAREPRCCGGMVTHLSAEQGIPVRVWTAPPKT